MKKLLCLTLCLALIMGVMTGCAVKPTGTPGATGESSPEVSNEVTKEPTEETKEDIATISPNKNSVDKEENKGAKKEEKEPEKVEETPEFYDFMALDPEPEKIATTPQENGAIGLELAGRFLDYLETGKITFTKKEIYYTGTYDSPSKDSYISVCFKYGKTGFYSDKTTEKLNALGVKFGNESYVLTLKSIKELGPTLSYQGRFDDIKTALRILLEDHNVVYVCINRLQYAQKGESK